VLRFVWESLRGHAPTRPSAPSDALPGATMVPTPSGYLIPNRAMEWLAPSRREPVLV
jgi:hypothetical protein